MTDPKSTLRKRRNAGTVDGVPPDVSAWFTGERGPGWSALLAPDLHRVPEWWALWLQAHPDAVLPRDAPWIAWPETHRLVARIALQARVDRAAMA
jgi:hypothetical protein